MGAHYFGIHKKKGGIYDLDLDPQSKSKLGEASLRPTHTISLFCTTSSWYHSGTTP